MTTTTDSPDNIQTKTTVSIFPKLKAIAHKEFPFLKEKKPLHIGVGDIMKPRLMEAGLSDSEANLFMKAFFNSARYLINTLNSEYRYDLDGNVHSACKQSEKRGVAQRQSGIIKRKLKRYGSLSPKMLMLSEAVEAYKASDKKLVSTVAT